MFTVHKMNNLWSNKDADDIDISTQHETFPEAIAKLKEHFGEYGVTIHVHEHTFDHFNVHLGRKLVGCITLENGKK